MTATIKTELAVGVTDEIQAALETAVAFSGIKASQYARIALVEKLIRSSRRATSSAIWQKSTCNEPRRQRLHRRRAGGHAARLARANRGPGSRRQDALLNASRTRNGTPWIVPASSRCHYPARPRRPANRRFYRASAIRN